jgi:hypothetical protein
VDEILVTKPSHPHPLSFESERKYREVLTAWIKAGEPPISEYRLTFGKHRGKRLDEVPD